jgi:hypothetical protein
VVVAEEAAVVSGRPVGHPLADPRRGT